MKYKVKIDTKDKNYIRSFIGELRNKGIIYKNPQNNIMEITLTKNKNDIDDIVQIADELGVPITIKEEKSLSKRGLEIVMEKIKNKNT